MRIYLLVVLAACGSSQTRSPAPPPSPIVVDAAPVSEADASPPSETASLLATAALTEQYLVGKAAYEKHACDTCHESHGEGNPTNPPVIGPTALPASAPAISKLRRSITFTTAADVVAFVRANMPLDKPGSLSEIDAYAVTAWILDESKVPLRAPLDATTAPTIKLR